MSDVDDARVSEMSPLADACCVDGAVVAQLAQPQSVTVVSVPALSDKLSSLYIVLSNSTYSPHLITLICSPLSHF